MTINSTNDRINQFRINLGMVRWFSVLIVFYTVSQISPCACLGVDRPDFATLRQMHKQHYENIRTGILQMRYTRYNYQSEREISEIMSRHEADPNSPPEIPKYVLLSEQKMDLYQNYTFALSVQKYKLDEEPADPNLYKEPIYSSMGVRRIILSSEGTELHYSKNMNHAVVDYYANTLARTIPAYLGVISQRHFEELKNLNVTVFKDNLDDQNVVVYQLTETGRNDKLRIYTDPAIGYRYRQVESFSDGNLVRKIIAKNYKLFDGIPFPTFHEDTTYRSDPNSPIKTRHTIQVINAQFNLDIDPNAFKIRFSTDSSAFVGMSLNVQFRPCPDKSAKLGVQDILDRALSARGEAER